MNGDVGQSHLRFVDIPEVPVEHARGDAAGLVEFFFGLTMKRLIDVDRDHKIGAHFAYLLDGQIA